MCDCLNVFIMVAIWSSFGKSIFFDTLWTNLDYFAKNNLNELKN